MSEIRICKYCGMELSEDIPHGLRECHLRAVARVAELEEKQRWIPVSEKLPEMCKLVLIYNRQREIEIDFLGQFNRKGEPYYPYSDDAVYWMPLPKAPEDE